MNDESIPAALGRQFEAVFKQLGIPFEFVTSLPIEAPQMVHAVQVRSTRIAPADRVARYSEQMRAGAEFPPIVIRKHDQALIDGNTRLRACEKVGRATVAAYLVSPRNDRQALELGGALNQLGGKDLEPQELRRVCLSASESMSAAAVSKVYGVSASKIHSWVQQDKTIQHAKRLGFDPHEVDTQLSGRQQELAARIVNDRAFSELVNTMMSTEPVHVELNSLTKAVADAHSEDQAVEAIQQAAAAWPARAGTRTTSRTPALGASMHIGALVKPNVQHWIDLAHRDTLLPKWEQLADTVAAVIAAYRAAA